MEASPTFENPLGLRADGSVRIDLRRREFASLRGLKRDKSGRLILPDGTRFGPRVWKRTPAPEKTPEELARAAARRGLPRGLQANGIYVLSGKKVGRPERFRGPKVIAKIVISEELRREARYLARTMRMSFSLFAHLALRSFVTAVAEQQKQAPSSTGQALSPSSVGSPRNPRARGEDGSKSEGRFRTNRWP